MSATAHLQHVGAVPCMKCERSTAGIVNNRHDLGLPSNGPREKSRRTRRYLRFTADYSRNSGPLMPSPARPRLAPRSEKERSGHLRSLVKVRMMTSSLRALRIPFVLIGLVGCSGAGTDSGG